MSSWLKTSTKALYYFMMLCCICVPVHANEGPIDPTKPFVDHFYPEYPPTTPAEGERKALIEKGEYLSKMGDCISCHTNMRERTPAYAGGLPLATPFGTFYSPNITPDKKTGIGNWSEEDFIRAMKHGKNPQGKYYFPVFPYVYFAHTTDEDAKALYAYFMSIPAVEQENKSLPFPFNMPGARFSLLGWNLLFFYPNETLQYDSSQSPEWNRGRYIVDGLGHCSMCHTPLNPLGSPKTRHYLTGGFIDGYWAPNITANGLRSATRHEVADLFVNGQLINLAGPIKGPMAEVNHNSMRYMTLEDRLAIATYLKSVVSEEPLGVSPSDKAPSLARGREVYVSSCTICHQKGVMSAPVLGDGPGFYNRLKEHGLTGLYRHSIHGYNSMPYRGACVTCSDNDIISAVDYMLNKSLSRSQWKDVTTQGEKKFPASGKQVYEESCVACHGDGVDGAPKLGDKARWESALEQNLDELLAHVIKGKHHPEKGGCAQCTTGEVAEAIKYMISQSAAESNYSLW